MMNSSVDFQEVAKFAQHADQWWAPDGALHTLHDINPARIQYIEQFVDIAQQRILDIGCGGGILAEGMAKRGGRVTGLDVEPQAIAVATNHAQHHHLSIDYHCQPLETFTAEPFPIITCLEMLEHVPDPQLIIKHAARLLAPGGYLFLSTIDRNWKAYARVILGAEYLLRLLPRQTHDYQRFIKPSELATMVRKNRLELIDLKGLFYHPFTRTAEITSSIQDNYLLVCRSKA